MIAWHLVGTGAFTGASVSPFDPTSPQAAAIRDLFTSALFLCGGVFLVVAVLVFYCAFRFRGSGPEEPEQVEGNKRLEIGWTIAPVLVLALLLMLTVRAMNASDPPVDRDPDVTIIGHQWWWEIRYPSGVVTANEVHIPTGKALVFRLESADVIHDFWVPELGRKMDATPGRPSTIWLEADKEGRYVGTCAEYCGLQHAWMRILVVAEAPESFAAWQRRELAAPPASVGAAATRGEETFRSMACVNCHNLGSTGPKARFAPDLTHLASRSTLGAGVLSNTPEDLARWLKDPQSIKTGCHMPDTQLSDAQVSDLVSYMKALP